VEYGLLMPTILEYTQSLGGGVNFYAAVMASFAFFRALATFAFGSWSSSRRALRPPLLFSFAAGLAGDSLYCAARGRHSAGLLLLARAVCGGGAATGALTQAYIGRAASPDRRQPLLTKAHRCGLAGILTGE
jgi:MFS family permease